MGRGYIGPLLGLVLAWGCQTREYELFYKQTNGQASPEDNGGGLPQSGAMTDMEVASPEDLSAATDGLAAPMEAADDDGEDADADDGVGEEGMASEPEPCFGPGEYSGEYTCYLNSVIAASGERLKGEIRFRVGDSRSGDTFQSLQSGVIGLSLPRPEAAPDEPLTYLTLPIDGQAVCGGLFYAVAGDYEMEQLPQLAALVLALADFATMRIQFFGSWHGDEQAFWGEIVGTCDGCEPFCEGSWTARIAN